MLPQVTLSPALAVLVEVFGSCFSMIVMSLVIVWYALAGPSP